MLRQLFTYLGSGGLAFVLAYAFYALLLQLGVWYVTASVLSDGFGMLVIFVCNKYLVFQKRDRTMQHAWRYAIVQALNTAFQAAAIWLLVEHAGIDKHTARIIAIGVCVPVNFVLYKYVVYV